MAVWGSATIFGVVRNLGWDGLSQEVVILFAEVQVT